MSPATVKRTKVVMSSARYSWPFLTKFEFSRRILKNVSSTKFDGNPSSESRPDIDGRTDVSKEIIVFLDLRERACNFTCIAKPSELRGELLRGDLSDRVGCEPRGVTRKAQVELSVSTA